MKSSGDFFSTIKFKFQEKNIGKYVTNHKKKLIEKTSKPIIILIIITSYIHQNMNETFMRKLIRLLK